MEKNKISRDKIFDQVIKNITLLLQMTNREGQGTLAKIDKNTDIVGDLGMDSIEVMDLLGMLEKDFAMTLDIKKFGQQTTLNDVVEFIAVQLLEQNG